MFQTSRLKDEQFALLGVIISLKNLSLGSSGALVLTSDEKLNSPQQV
jgi:hypothetical protein